MENVSRIGQSKGWISFTDRSIQIGKLHAYYTPLPLFGIVSVEARGHVVTTILIAMVGMLFTAISYGRMARAYPAAGSARKCCRGMGIRSPGFA